MAFRLPMWVRLRALIVKELLALLRDPKSRVVLIVPPLVQLFVFSFAATLEVKNVSMAVLDEDHSRWSWELIQRFRASPTFADVVMLDGARQIQSVLDRQQVLLVLRIGETFARDLEASAQPVSGAAEEGGARPASLQLILDGRRSNTAQIVQGYAAEIISGLARDAAAARGGASARSGSNSAGSSPAVAVIGRNWFNPNLIYRWFTVPSIIALLMTVTGLIVTGLSLARERELATLDQLLVSPLTTWEILLGKTIPAVIVGAIQAVFFVSAAVLVLQVPFNGSLALLFLSLFVFMLSVIGIGLFISSLAQTQQQAILGALALISPAVLLSGFASPVESMPGWLQVVAEANPLKHFMIIARGVFLKDMPAALVLANTWPMVAIAAVTLTAAALVFRRKLGS